MNSLMYHSWVRKSVSWGIYHQKRPFRFKGFSTTHPVGNSTEIHMDFIWLVVSTPLKNMKVNLWKNKFMFQTTNQLWFIQYVQGISYESHPPNSNLSSPGSGDSARSAEAVPGRGTVTRQVMEETKVFANRFNRCSIRQVFRRTIT